MDVDTRLLRYFVAVAEAGTLTRAAEVLFVSQPALTKQIRRLERELGVRLFSRSHDGMALTEAGEALLQHAPRLLARWQEARRATRRAEGRAAGKLRLGFLASAANESTQTIITEFTRRRPGWRVDMRQAPWSDPSAGLNDGHVDVALLRLPFPTAETLRVVELFTEQRCVALPTGHPLAERARVPFDELLDEPFVAAPEEAGGFRDYWLARDERRGRPVRIGAVTDHPDAWLNAIANGYGVALAPESAARFYARPGITYRPVSGIATSTVGVAWHPADDRHTVVRTFVECCVECTAGGDGT
uniref:LysR family transcriptional regulator n=1 Tax=Streptomyces chumphonensis TaxID=1214925 RepID=UPI003D74D7FC